MSELPELMITDSRSLAECCDHLASVDLFGFDTEFIGEDTYHPDLCLVQVATRERRYLIDPIALDSLDPFWTQVNDPAKTVIVHAGREEIRLCNLWSGRPPGTLVDVQIAAGLIGLGYPLGHAALLQTLLGVQLSKGETLTDWRKRPLTKSQVRYAFDDVRYLIPLWNTIQERLDRLGRLEWATEEFRSLIRRAIIEAPDSEKWRKLRGIGGLDRRRLAIVRALFIWREEQADRTNRPARVVLRDDLIVEIAKRIPSRSDDLQVLRGIPKFEANNILNVVEQANTLPAAEWPEAVERDADTPQTGIITALLHAVFQDWCNRESLTPGLVATMSDLRQLVRSQTERTELPPTCLLAQGWRHRHVMPELVAVLEGRKRIRIANLRADAPLEYDAD